MSHQDAPAGRSPNGDPFWSTPHWFPHLVDANRDRLLLVERSEPDLRAASFLDDRSLTSAMARRVVAWESLAASGPADARRDTQFIFHIGHVGSTLISRLLGEIPSVLSLREPLMLRTFAEQLAIEGRAEAAWAPESIPGRIDLLTALLSRTFRAGQRALVKATSFVSEIAPRTVPEGSRAVLLYDRAPVYLANILAGDASRQELQQLAAPRLVRLNRRAGGPHWKLWELDEAGKAALAWASEMTSLHQAAGQLPSGSTLWIEFDRFLAAPAQTLERIAAFLGIDLPAGLAAQLCAGPLMQRYSKALEHDYSPDLRRQVLAQSERDNGPAIAAARRLLEDAARAHPALADCLARAD